MNIIEGLIQHQIEFARHIKKELPNILSSGASSGTMDDVSNYSDANYKLCANGLALLYQLNHPKNSLRGEPWLKEGALQLLGKYLEHVEILPDGTPKLKEIGSEWAQIFGHEIATGDQCRASEKEGAAGDHGVTCSGAVRRRRRRSRAR